jgi:ABC-type multidrug transport system ATPase subunit
MKEDLMRISSVRAVNFKSLVDFNLTLPKFSCLVGLNGAGKSTVLQFLDFIAQQVRGDIKGWLGERNWRPTELRSRLTTKKNIEFEVSIVTDSGTGGIKWNATFNPATLSCTAERIETPGATLEVDSGHIRIVEIDLTHGTEQIPLLDEDISFSYQGSVLSQLKVERLPQTLIGFRNYFTTITSLDLLSPELLRQRTREAAGSIGLGGQHLSAFLHEMGAPKREKLLTELRKVYGQLAQLRATSLRSGWKQIDIVEHFGKFPLHTEARHINDGMLRLMAILAELETESQFLLFDEIENGMNPELIQFIVNSLVNARQQILVTTHSPMILNFIADSVAKEGIIYIHKIKSGETKALPFFSIPSLAEKLKFMGPGEAFADTNLIALPEEIAQTEAEA